jgi:hypothetical protein
VFVSKTAQLGVQMKSRNESFGFFVFKNECFLGLLLSDNFFLSK